MLVSYASHLLRCVTRVCCAWLEDRKQRVQWSCTLFHTHTYTHACEHHTQHLQGSDTIFLPRSLSPIIVSLQHTHQCQSDLCMHSQHSASCLCPSECSSEREEKCWRGRDVCTTVYVCLCLCLCAFLYFA